MKNIYLLPTDKLSSLVKNNKSNRLFLGVKKFIQRNGIYTNQHIYITSEEEIIDGEKCITFISDKCMGRLDVFNTFVSYSRKPLKIIITTDQNLINDGIQVIDYNFLQWFIKNTSCEKIEVIKYHQRGDVTFKDRYKIIINH